MSYLVANLPPIQCYIRKEYLYDFQGGVGEFEPCYWVSVKSIKGKALYIESLLVNYGALYDKLPISAYVWKTDIDESIQHPLDFLEIWDSFSYNISVIEKSLLKNLQCKVLMKDKKLYDGQYMFTVDSCSSEPNELNVSLSETPNEHKSFNIIKLDNGQFAAQPNNRIVILEPASNPKEMKIPDFNVATTRWNVEMDPKWDYGLPENKWRMNE